MKGLHLLLAVACLVPEALSSPAPVEMKGHGHGAHDQGKSRGLIASAEKVGTSSRFFGALTPFVSPYGSPFGGYGGYPPYTSSFGYPGGIGNFGSFYPTNPGFYGNSFGGYSSTQQQQQQQTSQVGAGSSTGIGGYQSPFLG